MLELDQASRPARQRPVSSGRRLTCRVFWALLMTVVGALSAGPASAHPHIWVTTRTTVLFENGTIIGFRHDWTFDESYTLMAIDGLDTDKDGKYSREELAELAKVNVEALKEFAYFTAARLGNQELSFQAPTDYYLEHGRRPVAPQPAAGADPGATAVVPRSGAERIAEAAGGAQELTLHFTLPLAKPVLADAESFGFWVGDPTFFIAFDPAAKDPVVLGKGAPAGCEAVLAKAEKPVGTPSQPGQPMAETPPDLTIKVVSQGDWRIRCGKS